MSGLGDANLPQHPVKSRFAFEMLDPVLEMRPNHFGQNLFHETSLQAALPLSQGLLFPVPQMQQVQRARAAESSPVLATQHPAGSHVSLPNRRLALHCSILKYNSQIKN